MNEIAQKLSRALLQKDDETDFRIEHGTEMYRKGFGTLTLVNAENKPVPKATVKLKQKSHEYLFGCNAFMLGQFPSEEQNRQYESVFSSVFNEAVVPFYWSDLEPVDGKPRFEHGSKPDIYRRPPPDDVLEFCRKNGILPKGHPLCWHCFMPDWAPKTPAELMRRLERRIAEIAERYADQIHLWDCVNETLTLNPFTREGVPAFPPDYAERAFKMADRYFPMADLIYNDNRCWWNYQGDYSPVYLLAKSLQEHGCRLGGLGLQYHMFESLFPEADLFMTPRYLYRLLNQYAKLNVPINFSEVSIVSRRDFGDGDRFQELVTERLYRIWFSHPATAGITWWNLVDGTGAYAPLGSELGENSLRAGLVNYDFSAKPAFKVLDRLINQEWRTSAVLNYEAGARNQFHGFYGKYDLEISTDSGVFHQEINLSRNMENQIRIQLETR